MQEPTVPRTMIILLVCQLLVLGILTWKVSALATAVRDIPILGAGGIESLVEAKVDEVVPGSGPSRGADDASVELVVFSNYQCSACAAVEPALERLLEESGDQVRLTYRHFPFASEGRSLYPSLAAVCAERQQAFWPMHELLFEDSTPRAIDRYVARLDLDEEAFDACLTAPDALARIEADRADGVRWGVTATPTLFVNGRRVVGSLAPRVLDELVASVRAESV